MSHAHAARPRDALLPPFPRPSGLVLLALRPVLKRFVRQVAQNRPELFDRIGAHTDKSFVIDPTDMPFVLILQPDPYAPRLVAKRRSQAATGDARIAGRFLTLLDLVDGRLDGDALFFTRDLHVSGNTEAVVCLRNALDDLDGSIADDFAAFFGPGGRLALATVRQTRSGHDGPA